MIKRENSEGQTSEKVGDTFNYKMYFYPNKSCPKSNIDFYQILYSCENLPIFLFFYDIDDFGENSEEVNLFYYLRSKLQKRGVNHF